MRNRWMCLMAALPVIAALASVLIFSSVPPAHAGQQQAASPTLAQPAPKRDLSGVWLYQGSGSAEDTVPEKDMPPMTSWAKVRFDTEKPGYGSRANAAGNDPILQCDPMGFPRIMFMPRPFEFQQIPGKVLQFFERDHTYRAIWTDGRAIPQDADPTWYGFAVGYWDGDYTFVAESADYNDKTWLGAGGYPHSDEMRVTERYQRVDHDTILYNITVVDPKAYTKPLVAPQRTMKLRPGVALEEAICVWTEENAYAQRIRVPAAKPPAAPAK